MPLDSNDVIWSEGYRACSPFDEVDNRNNPYKPGTIEYELWDDGYEDALEDAIQ